MAKKSKAKTPKTVETLEQFLARGGSVKLIPSATKEAQVEVTRKTTQTGPAIFLSLEEADLFFGEPSKNTKKAKKPKQSLKIDLDALPAALRSKFIAKLKEGSDGEGYEEKLEEIEEEFED